MDLSPVLQLLMVSNPSTSQEEHSQLLQVSLISDSALSQNSAQSSKMSALSLTCQSLSMPTLASVKARCVPEQCPTTSSLELPVCTCRIKSFPSDVATSEEKNWSLSNKWSIKSKSPGKPPSRFPMVSLSYVQELMQRESLDLTNASTGLRLISMLVLTWFSHKVSTRLKSSRL